MDFTSSEVDAEVRGLARDIAAALSTDTRIAELETAGTADADLWHELGAAGLLGLELPTDAVGEAGADLSIIESLTVAEQLGRHLARVPFGPHAVAAAPMLARHGSHTLRASLLAAAATGSAILTVAVEEELPGDPLRPQTSLSATAQTGTRTWSLSGAKVNVPYAGDAAAIVVNALTGDGAVAVVVDSATPGVKIIETPVTGRIPTYVVEFDDVMVTGDAILAGGRATVAEITDRLTLAVCADQSGALTRALEMTAAYAAEREQFGRPIGSFQAVAQRLADGYIDVQGLSLTTAQAAWTMSQRDVGGDVTDPRVAVQTAKFWACEAGHRVAHTAIHVHGGVGLDTSHPAHRYFLRAKQNEFTLGAAPATLAAIGAALATAPA